MPDRSRTNTQTLRDRRKLVADFQRRLQFAEPVDVMRGPRSTAIFIHPAADELELLAQIGAQPAECDRVDGYWHYGDAVYWLQVLGSDVNDRAPGVYYRFNRQHRQDHFEVVLTKRLVYLSDLQSIMQRLETLVDSGVAERERAAFQGSPIQIADVSTEVERGSGAESSDAS